MTAILVTDDDKEFTVQVSPLTKEGDRGAYVTLDNTLVRGIIVYIHPPKKVEEK